MGRVGGGGGYGEEGGFPDGRRRGRKGRGGAVIGGVAVGKFQRWVMMRDPV